MKPGAAGGGEEEERDSENVPTTVEFWFPAASDPGKPKERGGLGRRDNPPHPSPPAPPR